MTIRDPLARIGELLAQNGCDCDCDHHPDEHDEDCVRCLACLVGAEFERLRASDE